MKYIKISTILFAITAIFAAAGAKAQVVTLIDITIPVNSNVTSTSNYAKDNFSEQYATKTTCKDDLSGNEMAIQGRTYQVGYGSYTSWVSLPKETSKQLTNGTHNTPGTYKLNLKATNSFITTGSFYGSWNLN